MRKLGIIFIFLMIFCTIPVFAAPDACEVVNSIGRMNQTQNMTAGQAATVDVNATFTGSPGTNALVTNIGSVSAALLNFVIPAGATGPAGSDGLAATISVNTTFTGDPGTSASVTNIGSSSAAIFNFLIPRGNTGATGPTGPMNQTQNQTPGEAATISVNDTFTGTPGSNAIVTNIGSSSAASLDFTIPPGVNGTPGTPGSAATVGVNSTFTGLPGANADVVNVGSSSAASLDFTIPQGTMNQTPGSPGSAATIGVNNTFTGSPGTTANVVNIGSSSAASLDFTIPQGLMNQTPGSAATIGVNATFTGAPGTNANVVNIGSSSAASLDFTVPQGAAGSTDHAALSHLAYADAGHTGFEPTVTKGNLGASSPISLDNTRQVIGGTATISLINDAAAAITEIDTGALANLDTVIATAKAVTTALSGKENTLTKNNLVGTSPITASNTSKVIGDPVTLTLVNDAAATITQFDTSALSNLDTDIPTSKAVTTALSGKENTLTKSTLSATSPVSASNSSQVIGSNPVALSLVNDAAAAITQFDTSALSNLDTDIPTSKAVTTALSAKAPNPSYAYLTLMAGSAMVPTTNPATLDQTESSAQKNNYIYGSFTDGGSENLQWIVDLPADWNGGDATNGKITATFLWTAASGSGTVCWNLTGERFPDDAAIDTALAQLTPLSSSTDTLITAEDMHVSPDTTAATIASVGTGGQTVIFKVTRNSTVDTLNAAAKLIGVRIKYIRTLA